MPSLPPRAVLDLGAVPTASRCARAWTREILWEWGAAELADTAELLVSELVTNSLQACAGLDLAAIRLVLTLDRGELAILVRDSHPGVPLAVQPGAGDESGRGLLIVEQLSDRCGWYPLSDPEHAKVTWAVLTAAGQAASRLPPPALPARRRPAPAPARAARAPRPVDPHILARVKSAWNASSCGARRHHATGHQNAMPRARETRDVRQPRR